MKKVIKKEPSHQRYRLNHISMREIKEKYPDKVIGGHVEHGRLVIQTDTCRIKFDERVKQRFGDKYGAIHTGKLVETT